MGVRSGVGRDCTGSGLAPLWNAGEPGGGLAQGSASHGLCPHAELPGAQEAPPTCVSSMTPRGPPPQCWGFITTELHRAGGSLPLSPWQKARWPRSSAPCKNKERKEPCLFPTKSIKKKGKACPHIRWGSPFWAIRAFPPRLPGRSFNVAHPGSFQDVAFFAPLYPMCPHQLTLRLRPHHPAGVHTVGAP